MKGELGVSVTTPSEQFFYHQISFFLKTFFFVYIGVLIDISDYKALIIGGILSFLLMGARISSLALTRKLEPSINTSFINKGFTTPVYVPSGFAVMPQPQEIHANF